MVYTWDSKRDRRGKRRKNIFRNNDRKFQKTDEKNHSIDPRNLANPK
jgi:hypothetical protein